MRKVVLTLALMLASGSAMAGSIEHIRGDRTSNDSVISISCAFCPAPAAPAVEIAAPAIEPGTQNISVREISGRKETVRTEAWLGGSPVTYVSANPMWLPAATTAAAMATQQSAPVDAAVTTSAVEAKPETERPSDLSLLENLTDTPLRRAQ
ncbi:hypothetical protein G6L28_02715 [Agrobacterium larrymoorei]|uniref:plant virulence effector HPE1-like domain-containing protein n=1 Tax=Agrobacterium larrymoorei TaxID=160699 RepID=UPI001571F44C|nr:plant virulence effector HPE1-like domain-containing protein [Agrobacterium larrymoorei]NTJ41510.1 hypothetical protein [Agrobacterium larrymoorei]